ncbi:MULTISPECIES: amidase family protein [Mesorhizobium]|uniref:amidase family protein n=1 Tax=Mesorhizobium TaxID=68287 RepID=UPI0010A9521C|nr:MULTISPECIES: amidase family protein [Mesorhizobium]
MYSSPGTLSRIAADLALGVTTSRALVEAALEKIAADGRAFRTVYVDRALQGADCADARRRCGRVVSPLDGIPFTVKDNMDVAGEVTAAGSLVLLSQPPAKKDAQAVAQLRKAGGIILAKTYMPELALASIGTSAHYLAPGSALDDRRVPGGSSSGAAVAVGRGVVPASLGTDTGGSVTIPAALNGIVGYKPTASLISLDGIVPLSLHLDTVGAIANSVDCCRLVAGALAGNADQLSLDTQQRPPASLRLAVPTNYVMDELDPCVSEAFRTSLDTLSDLGANIYEIEIAELNGIPEIYMGGGFAMPEMASWLKRRGLLVNEADFDPRMFSRISEGCAMSALAMLDKIALRQELALSARETLSRWDAIILPTTAIVAPLFTEVTDDSGYRRLNMRLMRNSRIANILDLCAVSIPQMSSDPSIGLGLLVACPAGMDEAVLDIADTIMTALHMAKL